MANSLGVKKAAVQSIIEEYHAPILRTNGFVSYKNTGFLWYRVKKNLLHWVAIAKEYDLSAPSIDIGFGIIPLFTWEHIGHDGTSSTWGWEYSFGCGRYMNTFYIPQDYWSPIIPNRVWDKPLQGLKTWRSVHILAPYTDRFGAEIMETRLFPLMKALETPEKVYEWNIGILLKLTKCRGKSELTKYICEYKGFHSLISEVIIDESLYCRDEVMFPAAEQYLEYLSKYDHIWGRKTKEKEEELRFTQENALAKLKALRARDWQSLTDRLLLTKEKMLNQIRRKLPDLSIIDT